MAKHNATRPPRGINAEYNTWYTLRELGEVIHNIGGSDAALAAEASSRFFAAGSRAGVDNVSQPLVIEMKVMRRDMDLGTGHGVLTWFALLAGETVATASSARAAKAAATRRNANIWRSNIGK